MRDVSDVTVAGAVALSVTSVGVAVSGRVADEGALVGAGESVGAGASVGDVVLEEAAKLAGVPVGDAVLVEPVAPPHPAATRISTLTVINSARLRLFSAVV